MLRLRGFCGANNSSVKKDWICLVLRRVWMTWSRQHSREVNEKRNVMKIGERQVITSSSMAIVSKSDTSCGFGSYRDENF